MVSTRDERYNSFIRRLREARIQAGLTQQDAARLLARPQSYVSRCETGERRVDVIEVAEFAKVYGVDARQLLPE
ncbi:MAG: hypothetical protein A2Z18_07970 [Armatimonadetes bacterium RBG_16_58_9]|nr:MAG: hypothetical protein A2Z18_07970 [Armatimonadetes bacterium RBG_16_58_9]